MVERSNSVICTLIAEIVPTTDTDITSHCLIGAHATTNFKSLTRNVLLLKTYHYFRRPCSYAVLNKITVQSRQARYINMTVDVCSYEMCCSDTISF